jgi:hypothetical protein
MSVPVVEKGYAARTAWWAGLEDDEETLELRWPLSLLVFNRMRRQDAQVMSVLRAVTLPIRRTTWRVDPAGSKVRVAKFVADELGLPLVGKPEKAPNRTRDRFSWSEHLRMALLMLPFGHSYFEQVYRIEEGQAQLRKLAWRPHSSISKIGVADDGGLDGIYQYGRGPQYQEIFLPVDRLVAYVNDREGGNWYGLSLLRSAYKSWLLKDRALRIWIQSLERNGLGVPQYTASEQPPEVRGEERVQRQQEEMDAGLALAQAYRGGDTAGAALPHGATLDLKGVNGKTLDAEPGIRYFDEQIARAVLAHFLNLGSETGSWALGSTFADFFVLSLQTVADQVADVATQHIVEDLVDVNFGESEPAPRIVFDEIGSKHPATAEAIRALADSGILTPDDNLEQHIRIMHGLPQADPSTARIKAPVTPALPPVVEETEKPEEPEEEQDD